jgi:hypothetical protein
MAEGIVQVGRFPDEASARLARAVLEANGIRSEVITSHYIGRGLLFPGEVILEVRSEDAEAARQLLKAAHDGPSA